MKKSVLLLVGFVIGSVAWAKEPATYFAGKYEVVSKDVKIKTAPKGNPAMGPSDLAETKEFEMVYVDDAWVLYVDSYNYPLAVYENHNYSRNGDVDVRTYSGNASQVVSTLKIRSREAQGGFHRASVRVVMKKIANDYEVTYVDSDENKTCRKRPCIEWATWYDAKFLLRKLP